MERLLFHDTFREGFGVVRFSQPVLITEIRIVPWGQKLFALAEHLLGSTLPIQFSLEAYVHLPPYNIGTFSKPASMLPLKLPYDGTSGFVNSFRLALPASTSSRMMMLKGDFEAVTVVLYGVVMDKTTGQPVAVPGLPPSLPPQTQQVTREPSIALPVPVAPDLEAIQRLLQQRPAHRLLDVDPFDDDELELAVSVFDGDRAALAEALARCLEADASAEQAMDTESSSTKVVWRDVLDWTPKRIGKMTSSELEAIATSLKAQDWMLDDDRPDWVTTRRMAAVVHKLAKASSEAAIRLLTVDFLERTMILACETSTSSTRLAFLSETLLLASHHPSVFLSLIALPSYPAFLALASPAREVLIKRRELVELLSTPLADEDDIYTLADCAISSSSFPAESVVRFLRHFNFLAALEPVLIDVPAADFAEPIVHVLSVLVAVPAGRFYLAQHLQEPGVLAGRLVELSAGRSVEGALLALHRMRLGLSIKEPLDLCKALVAIISITAAASGLQDPVAFSACANLRTLALDGPFEPIVCFVLADRALVSGLLSICQLDGMNVSAWALVNMLLSDPLLHLAPPSILADLDSDILADAPMSIKELAENARIFNKLSQEGNEPFAALLYATSALNRWNLAAQSDAVRQIASYANAVAVRVRDNDFLLRWAQVGGKHFSADVMKVLSTALDATDKLLGLHCEQVVAEVVHASLSSNRQQTLVALLDLTEVLMRLLKSMSKILPADEAQVAQTSIRAYFFVKLAFTQERAALTVSCRQNAANALYLLGKVPAAVCLASMTKVCAIRPRLLQTAAALLLLLMPSTASSDWARACARHLDFLLGLQSASLSERLKQLDETIGLTAMLADVEAESKALEVATMQQLSALLQRAGDEISMVDAGGVPFSVKSYKGDAFRLQAIEKANLTRPPSMHVDNYGTVSQ